MRTVETVVFKFDELTETAKEQVREWWRSGDMPLAWMDESLDSISAFCEHFGINLRTWSVDLWSYDFTVRMGNENFRGKKLRHFDRHHMPTGFYLDCVLWEMFFDMFKKTGDAKLAFEHGLDAGFKAWRDDIASQYEDEYIDDLLIANAYEFTADGELWT